MIQTNSTTKYYRNTFILTGIRSTNNADNTTNFALVNKLYDLERSHLTQLSTKVKSEAR